MSWTTAVWDGAAADWPWHREHLLNAQSSGTVAATRADELDHFCHTRPKTRQFGRAVEEDPRRMAATGGSGARGAIVTAIAGRSVSLCTYW